MSEQLQKIMHGHSSSDSSPNTSTAKKKLLGKSPGSTSKKNPHVIVSATEIKFNSSFFNKDANTTLPSDMNATRLHFDSSDSEEDLDSRRKKKDRP